MVTDADIFYLDNRIVLFCTNNIFFQIHYDKERENILENVKVPKKRRQDDKEQEKTTEKTRERT